MKIYLIGTIRLRTRFIFVLDMNILFYQFADVLRSTNCCYSVGHSEAAVLTTYKALIPQSEKANTQYTQLEN